MVHSRISSKTKNRFRNSMRDVVTGLGRDVVVYRQPLKADCPNCFYDKLTDSSTGKCKWTALEARNKQIEYIASGGEGLRYKFFRVGRCPVCKSKGFLETERKIYINCLVTWNPQDRNKMIYTPAGSEGSTIVSLKTDPKHFDLFKNASKLLVDNVVCKLSTPPILRGLGNQTVLVIKAFTTEKPSIDSNEIIKDYSGG